MNRLPALGCRVAADDVRLNAQAQRKTSSELKLKATKYKFQ
jgi:hypothetical protein